MLPRPLIQSARTIKRLRGRTLFQLDRVSQGLAGAVGVVVTRIGLGLLYLYSKRNLWPNVICHGLKDAVNFVAIYFGAPS